MKALLGAVAASVFVAVAILFLSWTYYFPELNSTAYDYTLWLAGPVPVKSPTLIVAIDEDSLRRVGGWPWSRDKIARLIDRIETGSPRAIAIDILLNDKTTPDADYLLTTAIANAHAVVLGTHLELVNRRKHWSDPDPKFMQKHVRLGHVHTDTDSDRINRRIWSAKSADSGAPVPAFSIQALNAAEIPLQSVFERKVGAARVFRPEPFNIRFVGDTGTFRRVPAWELLEGAADPAVFKGQIVLIGSTAEGVDQWFTPFDSNGRQMSGVEIHANAIETLYSGRAITEAPALLLLVSLFLYVMLLWWLDRRFEGRSFYVFSLLTGPAVLILSWILMKYADFWLPFPPFGAALVVVVPGLEVAKLVRVNWDLDRKIERLSSGWLSALNWYEPEWTESAAATQRRASILSRPRRNARWKLDAIDFFNDELMRFLSFNNAIL